MPAPPASAELNLKVVSESGDELFFKLKSHTQLRKLTACYAHRAGVSPVHPVVQPC